MSYDPNVSPILPVGSETIRQIQQEAATQNAKIVASEESLGDLLEPSLFNPAILERNFRELGKHRERKDQKQEIQEPETPQILGLGEIEEAAQRREQNNHELNQKTLLILRSRILPTDTPEEVLEKVLATYPDPALADEALDFLLETAEPNIRPLVQAAKEQLLATREREVIAGRNMGVAARTFSKEGLGSPTSLRDLYRDITGNAREPIQLFAELTDKFAYNKLKPILLFLLHSLGADLKAKGSSIPHPELKRLIDEVRSLQGILGVFRFFQSRMPSIARQCLALGLPLDSRITFETLAKIFIRMLAERYMNTEKILQIAQAMGIEKETALQIILFTQMRDGLKQVSPRYFRTPKQQEDLQKLFLDTLEDLEEKLEEEEEEEDK